MYGVVVFDFAAVEDDKQLWEERQREASLFTGGDEQRWRTITGREEQR